MAALWPLLMWLPVLEAFYHAKVGVQKDFTMKLCLGEIMGGKAHKMIIQYCIPGMELCDQWFDQDPKRPAGAVGDHVAKEAGHHHHPPVAAVWWLTHHLCHTNLRLNFGGLFLTVPR